MQPLNKSERNNAFLGFLLLFLITIAAVIAVMIFSIEVPCRESEQLRRKIFVMQSEKELSDSFNVAMREAMIELQKFDGKGNEDRINYSVQSRINKMKRLIENVPDVDNSIYALVIQNISDLNDAKTTNKKLEESRNFSQNQ